MDTSVPTIIFDDRFISRLKHCLPAKAQPFPKVSQIHYPFCYEFLSNLRIYSLENLPNICERSFSTPKGWCVTIEKNLHWKGMLIRILIMDKNALVCRIVS